MNKVPIFKLHGKKVRCICGNIIIENALFITSVNQDGSMVIKIYQNHVSNMESDHCDYTDLLIFKINRYYASIHDASIAYTILSLYGINDLEEICK